MKKLSFVLSACILASAIAAPVSVEALFVENSKAGTLEDMIKALGDETLSFYNSDVYSRTAYAFTASGKCYHFSEYYYGSPVTVTDGTELPADEINKKLEQFNAKIEYQPETGYIIHASEIEKRASVYQMIASYKEVKSIDEKYRVYTDQLWTCDGVMINSTKTNDEIISSYPELELTYNEADTKQYQGLSEIYPEHECYKKYSNVRIFDFNTSLNENTFNSEYYSALKKLADNENILMTAMIADAASPEDVPDTTVNVYTSDKTDSYDPGFMYGDIDNSGKVDLSDLTMLSLYLLGDRELDNNQMLAADVSYNENVDIADLSLLRQYVVHDSVTLGKK